MAAVKLLILLISYACALHTASVDGALEPRSRAPEHGRVQAHAHVHSIEGSESESHKNAQMDSKATPRPEEEDSTSIPRRSQCPFLMQQPPFGMNRNARSSDPRSHPPPVYYVPQVVCQIGKPLLPCSLSPFHNVLHMKSRTTKDALRHYFFFRFQSATLLSCIRPRVPIKPISDLTDRKSAV